MKIQQIEALDAVKRNAARKRPTRTDQPLRDCQDDLVLRRIITGLRDDGLIEDVDGVWQLTDHGVMVMRAFSLGKRYGS